MLNYLIIRKNNSLVNIYNLMRKKNYQKKEEKKC